MKFFKVMMFALMALMVFTGCEKFTCNDTHAMSELAGTWTCVQPGLAEALVIKANGSVVSTGVENGEYWENVKGNIAINEGKITMTFEDGDNFEGHFDFIPGLAFSVCSDKGERFIYNYCKEDLADEMVGMWVRTQTPGVESETLVQTYQNDGKAIFTGFLQDFGFLTKGKTNYKVIGDLLIQELPEGINKNISKYYVTVRVSYSSNGTSLGDIHTASGFTFNGDEYVPVTYSWLRISQSLNLAGKKYDHSATYMSNAKGQDKDISFLNTKFNFAKMNGSIIDKFLKSVLYGVQFPNAKTFEYKCLLEGKNVALQLPMEVDGNKITIKMSSRNAAYRDIDVYAFQDEDCSQFHMYMPTSTFENFFGNLSLSILSAFGTF